MMEDKGYTPQPCPRCAKLFICRKDDIMHCQCMKVPLSAEDRAYITARYDGCLCADCLKALVNERRGREQNDKGAGSHVD